jgi:NAD(P)-dependent dehydrogenase (short-subunit alcohol dehydrogenase family)
MKTVLITGANKGIGFEIARQLGLKGCNVILSGRDPEKVRIAADRLMREHIHVNTLIMDVSDAGDIIRAAGECRLKNIMPDVLINNAAVLLKSDQSITKSAAEVFSKDYEFTLRTNAYGPIEVIRAFLPLMKRPGRIINISSDGGSMTDPVGGWSPIYCLSKSLLNAATRHLAYELKESGISVNAVCPGWVQTEMGGEGAPRSVLQGAETPVWLADEADLQITGKFFRDKTVVPW